MAISFSQLRRLDTSGLSESADAAVALGRDLEDRADEVVELARFSDGSDLWSGADAQAQNTLMNTLPPPLREAGGAFRSAAGTLDTLVGELNAAKGDLERAIDSYPELTVGDDGSVSWPPTTDPERGRQLQQQAAELTRLLRAAVDRADTADDSAVTELGDSADPNGLTLPDGTVVVNTGDGDNEVKVSTDRNGNVVVTVDGEERTYEPGTKLWLNTAGGNDNVTIDPSVDSDMTVTTGDGNDTVTDDESSGRRIIMTGQGEDEVTASGDGKYVFTDGGNDTVTSTGNGGYISTGDGEDTVDATGGTVNGGAANDTIRAHTGDNPNTRTTVYGGTGDDTIDGGTGNDYIDGGSGADTIKAHDGDDTVRGGMGTDYIDGQDGNDTLDGGADSDHVYGLDGDDTITGGGGDDNLEGGQNNDTIDGEGGKDLVSGGYGDDTLRGGADDDKIYAGGGKDQIDGGAGSDTTYAQDEDSYTKETETYRKTEVVDSSFIQIEGSEEYQDRVRADLDMLGSSPTGGKMLDALHDKVSETHNDAWYKPGEQEIVISETDGRSNVENQWPFSGSDVNMNFDPDKFTHGDQTIGSQSVMMHELGHVYGNMYDVIDHGDYENPADPDTEGGDPVSNAERQATGLDYDFDGDGTVDNVRDPDNPHPYELTHNAFNEEAGRPIRDHYAENKPPRESEWWEFWR